MNLLLVFGCLSTLVNVNCQRRLPPSNSDDTLNVFGVTPATSGRGSDRDSDSSSFSVIDGSRGSASRRDTGSGSQSGRIGSSFTNGGQISGSSNSDRRDSSDGDGSFGSGDTPDIGFDRLTTQSSDRGRGSAVGSDTDDGPSSFSSGSSGSLTRFPENFRIEVEVQRLENPKGITATGSSCDFLSKCDTKIYAIVDTEKPLNAWPGAIPVAKWPSIFAVTNNDSPTIGKVATRDVCGSPINQANLRVRAVDADSVSAEDEINKFECLFPITASGIASDATRAQWGDSMECKATSQVGKIKLFARQRAYQISSSNCNSQKF